MRNASRPFSNHLQGGSDGRRGQAARAEAARCEQQGAATEAALRSELAAAGQSEAVRGLEVRPQRGEEDDALDAAALYRSHAERRRGFFF